MTAKREGAGPVKPASRCCEACGRPLTPEMVADLTSYIWRHLDSTPLKYLNRGCFFGPKTLAKFQEAGYETLGDLARAGESLLDIPGVGPKALEGVESGLDDEIDQLLLYWKFNGGTAA